MTTDQQTTNYVFCTKCGAKNSLEAVYCLKCGTMLEAEELTRIARLPKNMTDVADDAEREIFSIAPTLLFVKIGYGLAIIGGLLVVAFFALVLQTVAVWIAVLMGLLLLLIPAFYQLKRKLVRYTLTDSKIEIDEGFISKTTRNVPLRTIQDVTVSATAIQRILGFGNLIIENAGENVGKIVLKNINSPKKYADILLRQMRQLNR